MNRCEIPLQAALFRVIDTEGTAREPSVSQVVEIAWVDVTFTGTERGRFSSLVKPTMKIPPGASAIHHIVDEDVANAPTLDQLDAQLLGGTGIFVAHSAEYDRTVLCLDEDSQTSWICTHRLAKHLWPEIENHSNQVIRYTLGLQPNIPKDTPSHRALADALVTAAILQRALPLALEKWPDVVTVSDLIDKIEAPALLAVVPFKTSNGQRFENAETDHLEWIVRTGAGGADCVFTAEHYLKQRYATSHKYRDHLEEECE